MAEESDEQPSVAALLRDPPEGCGPVAELYRHSARPSAAERALGARGGPFFVFCEQLGLRVFDEDLDVRYDEVVPLDEEGDALLRTALLAHTEHPEAVEDYAARLCWVEVGGGTPGGASA